LLVLDQVASRVLIIDLFKVFICQLSDKLLDDLHLVQMSLSRKKRLTADQLRKDTPHCPHVNTLVVVTVAEDNFRCSIPSCHHILCHYLPVLRVLIKLDQSYLLVDTPSKSKVTYLQVAVNVDE